MTITPIGDRSFGAIVGGVSLAHLGDDEFRDVEAALVRYGFLHVPDQPISDEEQTAFGRRFGELEFGAVALSNRTPDGDGGPGGICDIETQRMRMLVGNEAWHTDSTYLPISSKCAMLRAVTVPDAGGETEIADARAAYAELDAATKRRIDGLAAYHSYQYAQANDLGDFPRQDERTNFHGEAYLRPLVKVHPQSGVPSLFIGRHAFGIAGLTRAQSRELLETLLAFVVSDPRRVYTHRWQADDVLIWDNRAMLHRARGYDYAQPRVLIGTRVAGDPRSEGAHRPDDVAPDAGRRALAAELERLRPETRDRRYGATTSEEAARE